jgi:hypothetical protein
LLRLIRSENADSHSTTRRFAAPNTKETAVHIEFHPTKRTRYRSEVLALALILALVACKPNAQPEAAAKVSAPAAAQMEPTAVAAPAAFVEPAIKSVLLVDMPYAGLRKTLLDAGWLPLRDPMCWENVGGEARVCSELPEVESCSGDGRCAMNFASEKDGAKVRVTTYGDYGRWNTPGEESALLVKSVSFSPVKAALAAADPSAAPVSPRCPSRDFDAFLKAFATDPVVERRFTAPLVAVSELYSTDDGDLSRLVYVDGASYDDFNVAFAGDAFHFVDAEGKTDAAPLKLSVEAETEKVRKVRYLYGMSEGNSYRFEEQGDCWYLTEDPEPPSP